MIVINHRQQQHWQQSWPTEKKKKRIKNKE
jgi:hypothetical protein